MDLIYNLYSEEGNHNQLQYSCLENSMDREAWQDIVHGVAKELDMALGLKNNKQVLSIRGLPWWLSWQRIHLRCGRPGFDPWVGTIPWRRERLPTPVFLGFLDGSAGKGSVCSVGDLGLIPGLGRSPTGGHGTHSSTLVWRTPMDRGAWQVIRHGVTKSQT